MISTELWRATIGDWAGRTRSELLLLSLVITPDHDYHIHWHFHLSFSCYYQHIIDYWSSGIYPGSTEKNPNSSSTEHDLFNSFNDPFMQIFNEHTQVSLSVLSV